MSKLLDVIFCGPCDGAWYGMGMFVANVLGQCFERVIRFPCNVGRDFKTNPFDNGNRFLIVGMMFSFMHDGKEGLVAFASSKELGDSSLTITSDLEVVRIDDNPVNLVQLIIANEDGFLGTLGVLWWIGWMGVGVS